MRIFLLIIFCFLIKIASAQTPKNTYDSSFVCYFPCNLTVPAKFPGGDKAWAKYLQKNTNSALGNRCITIPKGKKSAKATVIVSFVISKWGYVTNVERLENDTAKVHPKLVAEAIRVIKASPRWVAERMYGKRMASRKQQAITWQVDKE